MRKLILMMLLVSASGSAMAEWVYVGGTDKYTVYANRATIHNKGKMAKIWKLIDYKETYKFGDEPAFKSTMHQTEYDCEEEQYRSLASSVYSENMGKGNVTSSDSDISKWFPISPGDVEEAMLKIACKNRKESHRRQ